jgi:NAD(P)-dependent dehydrogenase (short-subunit alcohol dehydrogenase family)
MAQKSAFLREYTHDLFRRDPKNFILKIIISGAGGGFGKLTVEELRGRGPFVAAILRDPGGRNQEGAAALRELGCAVVEMDVTSDASVERGIAAAAEALGGVDVVINNAGRGVLGLHEGLPQTTGSGSLTSTSLGSSGCTG